MEAFLFSLSATCRQEFCPNPDRTERPPAGGGARGTAAALLCAWRTVWRNETRVCNESSSLETRGLSAGPDIYLQTMQGALEAHFESQGCQYRLTGAVPARQATKGLSALPGASHSHFLPPGSQKPALKGSRAHSLTSELCSGTDWGPVGRPLQSR